VANAWDKARFPMTARPAATPALAGSPWRLVVAVAVAVAVVVTVRSSFLSGATYDVDNL
jgi:hypothetical protein